MLTFISLWLIFSICTMDLIMLIHFGKMLSGLWIKSTVYVLSIINILIEKSQKDLVCVEGILAQKRNPYHEDCLWVNSY